jgi:hypothetical protein
LLLAVADQFRQAAAALERRLSRIHLIEDEPQRVEIAAEGDLFAGELLRGHVGGRPHPHVPFLHVRGQTRQAEIGDADLPLPIDHDVGGLQVAVDHALVVGRGQTGADLPGDLRRLVGSEAPDPSQ